MKRAKSLLEIFERHYIPEPNSGCWLWIGALQGKGYGSLCYHGNKDRKSRTYKAHRVSYEIFKGPIPEGLLVCHTCDIKICVNPEHLYAGTAKQNTRDAIDRGQFVFAPSARGETNNRTRTTEDTVRLIRKDVGTGEYLSRKYGLSGSTISRIKHRILWSHVDD